jgi:large subunit ribosomal protein L15
MAGLHKHKWSYTVKYAPDHFGSNTFRPPNSESTERWANIFDLERLAGNSNELDLTSLGYQKLLGQGEINRSLKVRVGKASSSAIEKVKAAGGSIELEKTKEEPIEEKVKGKQQSTPESRSIDTKSKGQK